MKCTKDLITKYPRITVLFVLICIAITIGFILVVLAIALPLRLCKGNSQAAPDSKCVTKGREGAVATDDERCSKAGVRVLENGGNAVDAAVASLLCLGVVNFQSSGIGGGLMMLVAKKNTSAPEGYTVTVIDAREVAPSSAREDDYLPVNTSGKNDHSMIGTLSIAIPGELRGMEMALDLFSNNTPDKRKMIFKQAIKYAKEGFSPSWHLINATKSSSGMKRINLTTPFNLRDLVMSSDGEELDKGSTITRKKYARTLKTIRDKGFQEFYTGETAASLVSDINDAACLEFRNPEYCRSNRITMADLQSYRAIKRNPLQFAITGSAKVMYTAPAPASGSALALFLKIMQARVSKGDDDTVTYHYLLEASKFSNSHLMNLGDPGFNSAAHVTVDDLDSELKSILNKPHPEYAHPRDDLVYYNYMAGRSESSFGTTHVVVATSNGDVVTVTSTINHYFGSGIWSTSTGVILNDQMDDFYFPSGNEDRFPYNHVEGGKRPLSAATPAVMIDSNDNLRLALGASGGRKIPPAVGQSAFFIVSRGESIEDGIKRARVYATLDDKKIVEEVEMSKEHNIDNIKEELIDTYRHYKNFSDYNVTGISVVQGIELQGSTFCAYSDPRKKGEAAAYG